MCSIQTLVVNLLFTLTAREPINLFSKMLNFFLRKSDYSRKPDNKNTMNDFMILDSYTADYTIKLAAKK